MYRVHFVVLLFCLLPARGRSTGLMGSSSSAVRGGQWCVSDAQCFTVLPQVGAAPGRQPFLRGCAVSRLPALWRRHLSGCGLGCLKFVAEATLTACVLAAGEGHADD